MAGRGGEPAARTLSGDGVRPAKDQTPTGIDKLPEKQLSHDIDQEERARKIAEQDLKQKKKQASFPDISFAPPWNLSELGYRF